MANRITCNVCGGTSFHKDAGYYYCNECQTQSQDVQEQVFNINEEADDQPSSRQKSSRRIRSEKKDVDRLTTWECYNYILRGLVEELIQLGADVKLKNTVHILWFKYLNILEVTRSKTTDLPKIGAVHSKLDVEVIYGRSSKRKRKSPSRTSSPLDSVTNDSSQKTHSKHRRSFILAEYNEMSSTLPSEEVTNQSLTSLKTASDASSDSVRDIEYNKFAKTQLLKTMKKGHLKQHTGDTNNTYTCHKATYKAFPTRYTEALLINRDNVQLGDLLRFIREGHLSFHRIDHFYPDGYDKTQFNLRTWNEKHSLLSHYRMRMATAKLAHFLDVTSSVPVQNVIQLCRRYCHELNLPDEIWGYCVNVFSQVPPIMVFTKKSTVIPNYEGRAMSVIIFFLKSMFGLDDETEHHFAKQAEEINTSHVTDDMPMFVWDDWMFYVQYRKLLLTQHHFPTQYLYDDKNVANTDLFLNLINTQDLKFETEPKLSRESEVIQQLLTKFKDKCYEVPQTLTFTSSLTPFRSYTEVLANSDVACMRSYLVDVLNLNFSNSSIQFLINPFMYLRKLYPNSKIGLKHRGCHDIVKVVKYKCLKTERSMWRRHARNETFVRLTNSKTTTAHCEGTANLNLEDTVFVRDSKSILRNFEKNQMSSYHKHMKQLLSVSKKKNTTSSQRSSSTFKSRPNSILHYNPYERYLLTSLNVNLISNPEFNNFIKKFPMSFRTLLTECARITEQEVKELFDEFSDVEIYMCYVAKWTKLDNNRDGIANPNIRNLMAKAVKNW
ncbi:hypothetical protein RI129_006636 [Pyrocoelia pectoralis]|uniref:TATA box-binding protein-associated factor RNA polymerase I subunit B n=1 Tax=Pyrocoelia pectoralis TaxID=417401 RepID=A0AAN7ZPS8_9COLE